MQPITQEPRAAAVVGATPPIYDEPDAVPEFDQGTVIAVLSRVIDLAEGREPGHANRVAYVGTRIAEHLKLSDSEVEATYFASLLHDVEKIVRQAEAPGEQAAIGMSTDPFTANRDAVNRIVGGLNLSPGVSDAIADHHQFGWFASGRPNDPRPPISAQVVATAERLDSLAAGGRSALLVRRSGPELARSMASEGFEARVIRSLEQLTAMDEFWIGFYDNDLISGLMGMRFGQSLSPDRLVDTFAVIADLIDRRNGRHVGQSRRVADRAQDLARRRGEPASRAQLIRIAALLQDIGTLGVPAACVRKPDLLTIDELADVQAHPFLSRDILSELPGFGAISWWIGCHHERVDGRGYPAGLAGSEVPTESQIIGISETFEALVSDRPYRPAMVIDEAIKVLRGLAGTRFHPEIVREFEASMEMPAL